ncbi:tetratricopeptide repeat protein [bacterium]|nr:tetratricopeptide repeat protein [bacterium]
MKTIKHRIFVFAALIFTCAGIGYGQKEVINIDVTLMHEADIIQDSSGWAAYSILESFEHTLAALGYSPHIFVQSINNIKLGQQKFDDVLKKKFSPAQYAVNIFSRSGKNKIEYTIDAAAIAQKKYLLKKSVYSAQIPGELFSTHGKIIADFLRLMNPADKENNQKALQQIQITKNMKAYRYYLTGKVLQTANPTDERLNNALDWYQKAANEDSVFFQACAAQAAVHISKKEFERAFTTYTSYLQQDAKAKGVYSAIGDVYYDHLNDAKKAKTYFEKELTLNSQNSAVLVRLGYCAYDDKNYELAKQYAAQALKLNVPDSPALNLLGLSAMGLKDSAAAREHFQRAVRINSYEIPARKNLARMFELDGRFDDARALYSQIVEIDPSDAFALMSYANMSYLQNDLKQAVAHFMQAVIVKPELESPKENPIQIFQFISKNKKDVQPVQSLIDSLNDVLVDGGADAGDEFLYRAAIGYASLYYTNDFAEAANQFQVALKLRPDAARLRFYLAESYFRLDKLQPALDYYQIYADDAKDGYNFARCHLMIGKILIKQKKFEDAQLEILKSIRMYPNAESYYFYGLALKGAKQKDEAITAFEKAVKTYPNYTEAYLEMAKTFEAMKKFDKAIVNAQKAVTLDSNNYYARQSLSHIYFNLERWEDAEKEIVEGIRLMNAGQRPDASLYGDYGDILLGRKNPEMALAQYELQWRLDSLSAATPYRIAAIYALMNDERSALIWMLKAFHNNFSDFVDLEKNKMFNSVRNKPAFKELVKQYEQAYREELLKRIQQKK